MIEPVLRADQFDCRIGKSASNADSYARRDVHDRFSILRVACTPPPRAYSRHLGHKGLSAKLRFSAHRARTRHNRWMGSWVVWTIVAAAFTLGELHTNSFYLAPFAVGGAVAAVLAALGVGGLVAAVAFVAAAILFLLLLRPLAVRRRSPPALRTGAAALIGQPALVMERIANRESVGTVRIGGEVWTARAYDEEQVIAAGEQVEVVEIRGATALVMP